MGFSQAASKWDGFTPALIYLPAPPLIGNLPKHTHTPPPGPHTSESWGVKPEERGSRAPGPLQAPLPCPPTGNRSRRVSRAREMSERGDGRCEGKMN